MKVVRGFIPNIGVVEIQTGVVLSNGTTSKNISFLSVRPNVDYAVLIMPNGGTLSGVYVSNKSQQGCVLHYTDPGADRVVDILIL